jgi:hypothetical protein
VGAKHQRAVSAPSASSARWRAAHRIAVTLQLTNDWRELLGASLRLGTKFRCKYFSSGAAEPNPTLLRYRQARPVIPQTPEDGSGCSNCVTPPLPSQRAAFRPIILADGGSGCSQC